MTRLQRTTRLLKYHPFDLEYSRQKMVEASDVILYCTALKLPYIQICGTPHGRPLLLAAVQSVLPSCVIPLDIEIGFLTVFLCIVPVELVNGSSSSFSSSTIRFQHGLTQGSMLQYNVFSVPELQVIIILECTYYFLLYFLNTMIHK